MKLVSIQQQERNALRLSMIAPIEHHYIMYVIRSAHRIKSKTYLTTFGCILLDKFRLRRTKTIIKIWMNLAIGCLVLQGSPKAIIPFLNGSQLWTFHGIMIPKNHVSATNTLQFQTLLRPMTVRQVIIKNTIFLTSSLMTQKEKNISWNKPQVTCHVRIQSLMTEAKGTSRVALRIQDVIIIIIIIITIIKKNEI
jgi:hypothetical protein